jgi:hypothetical protein
MRAHRRQKAPKRVGVIIFERCLIAYSVDKGKRKAQNDLNDTGSKRYKEADANRSYEARMAYYGAWRLTSLPVVTNAIHILIQRMFVSSLVMQRQTDMHSFPCRGHTVAMVV